MLAGVQTTATARPPEHLAGLIERVTFFNEDTGFAVMKLKTKGHRDLVTVVGSMPSVSPGEWLQAEGHWFQDREFGLQFRATMLTSTPPTTLEGIEKYLGSGMVKGIGPVYARKLVAKFGAGIFDIIENESGRLEDVDGIGPMRRKKIKDAWAEQKMVREIMVFLHSHGVSTSRAVRIYKLYGDQAVEKVRDNPYILAKDIQGIGFKSADQIAKNLGLPHDSVARASAGVSYLLLEASGEGHCAFPVEELRNQAVELLGVNTDVINNALEKSYMDGELRLESIDGVDLVFLPNLLRAEQGIAKVVDRLCASGPSYPPIDIDKAIAWWEQKSGQSLAPSQRAALGQALNSRLLIITGGPGVGKTTLVRAILAILQAKKVKILLCAPTGRAAKRLTETTGTEARTIHRLLEVQGGSGFKRNEANPLVCDLLVVDECSMVDVSLMHQLLRALPRTASLLLVGDVDQLPSVGPGSVLADIISSGIAPVARLTEVFRQAAHSRIITNAHRINHGEMPELGEKEELSDFYFVERETPEAIAETLMLLIRERIPKKFNLDSVRDVQVLCPMNRASLGTRELNLALQNALNPLKSDQPRVTRFGWEFRTADKVMQTENNYDKEVFNGDIGQIVKIDPDEREVTIDFDGRKIPYDFGELDEITLAYAITIHKSQGSEFPAVVMPLATQHYVMLQRNLVYTAVTRGRKLVVTIGQRKALGMAVRNNQTARRYSGLLSRLKAGNQGRTE